MQLQACSSEEEVLSLGKAHETRAAGEGKAMIMQGAKARGGGVACRAGSGFACPRAAVRLGFPRKPTNRK